MSLGSEDSRGGEAGWQQPVGERGDRPCGWDERLTLLLIPNPSHSTLPCPLAHSRPLTRKQTSGLSWKEGNLDFTGAQMVATLKLISVAACYQDGQRKGKLHAYASSKLIEVRSLESLEPGGMSGELRRPFAPFPLLTLTHSCFVRQVRPTLLEFYSYLLAIGSLLSGPCYEFKDYMEYINRRGDWRKIPNPIVPGTMRFVKAVVCAAMWFYFYNYLKLDVGFIEGEAWRSMHFVPRVLLLWATVVAYRMKYYAVWVVSESMMIFSGFAYVFELQRLAPTRPGSPTRPLAHSLAHVHSPASYRPGAGGSTTTSGTWDRYTTSHIMSVEINPSMADVPRHWNICTGLWLRHYVYERLSPVGAKPSFVNMLVTQMVSGVWHGLLPGYWLFFATSAFIFQASRVIYRYEQMWPSKYRNAYPWWLLKVLVSGCVLNYAGSAFCVLELGESLLVWRSVGWFGHVWCLAVLAFAQVVPPKRRAKEEVKRA